MERTRTVLPWLPVLRLAALVLIIFNVISLAISMPAEFTQLHGIQPGEVVGSAFYGWTRDQIRSASDGLGLRLDMLSDIQLSADLIGLLLFWTVAGLLFWRKSATTTGLLAAYLLFFTGPGFSGLLMTEIQ
jgi:hypothetical protein